MAAWNYVEESHTQDVNLYRMVVSKLQAVVEAEGVEVEPGMLLILRKDSLDVEKM